MKVDSDSEAGCVMSSSFCCWPTSLDVVVAFDLG